MRTPQTRAVPVAAAAGPRCKASRSKTIAQNSSARVYKVSVLVRRRRIDRIFGCLLRSNRRFRLTFDDGEFHQVTHRTLAGTFFSFVEDLGFDPDGFDAFADVIDLRTGHRRTAHAVGDKNAEATISALVATSAGAIAWVGEGAGVQGTRPQTRELWKIDSAGQQMLDSGLGIAAASLKVSGSQISWTKDGVAHSVQLQ